LAERALVAIVYDARDFWRLSKEFGRLPAEIKAKVAARAMSRVAQMGASRVGKLSADRVNVPSGLVRERTKAFQREGEAVVVVRSNWISLANIGARQTRTGVTVRARGSYRHAFVAAMKSGHTGVMLRDSSKRLPITELFGPNPAHDITRNPADYQDLIDDVAKNYVLPRMLHELSRALPR
jgi:hypothetical protein